MTQLELLPPALSQGTAPASPPAPPGAATDADGGGGQADVRGDLAEEARRKYLNYALSVITARAIPDVRDGLKPVARRILFTMFHELRLVHDGRHRKSAKVVGDVIGKYHPHGDGAVYDAMVRLAQDFVMRAPLVDGHGNFGSIDGDSPAAYRYTEARLSEISSQLLEELSQDTVHFRDTFDGTGREPIVLPARFPQLLVNGGTGIAVGMATSVPPHNLGEVIKACTALIDDPTLTVKQLLKHVKGPDFPTGGELVASRADLLAIYETGRGSFKLRGRWKQVEGKEGPTLVVTEVPYGVEKAALVEEIGQIILSRKLPALVGVQDLSTREIYVELQLDRKATVDPELIMAYLFKHSRLQVSIKADFTVLVPTDNPEVGAPARLDLRQILTHFLQFRVTTVRKRLEYELRVLERRIHILEGFEKIFDGLDRAIKIIRASDGKADAAGKLMKEFGLDEEQVDAVLETKLYRLAKLEIGKIREELADKRKKAKEIKAILKSKERLQALVRSELEQVATRFADKRRTKIEAEDTAVEFSAESFIIEEDAVVLVTRDGWIKRQRTINLETTRMREGDEALALVGGSTRECLVILTNMGSAYVCRINDVPPSTGHGTPVQKLWKFKDGERVVAAVGTDPRVMPDLAGERPAPDEDGEEPYPHMLAVTKQGQSLRFSLWAHREPSTSRGRMYARLSEGDEVVSVFEVYHEHIVCALTRDARLLACEAKEVNFLAGAGKGVRFIKLDEGDEVVGAFPADAAVEIEKTTGGTHKLTGADREPATRGGKGRPVFKRGKVKRLIWPAPAVPSLASEGEGEG
jgi:DNA gyrase subunit A